jgi:uncharacterized protein (TIGR02271 family)
MIMQHTLVAVFDNRSDAQNALDELLASGFSRTDANISSADSTYTGSTTGATVGASGVHEEGVGASIKHFFTNLFGSDSDEHASRYSNAITGGRHVLTLTTESDAEVERASDIIERFNPVDIDDQNNVSGAMGATGYQSQSVSSMSGAQAGSLQRDTNIERDRTAAIPVVQEELKVGKRQVERGGVRVFSRIVETPVIESVSLREEHVNVERRPVDQPINPADVGAFKEKSIELRETAEEAVVQKSARVVEEVVVGKEVSQRQEQISDTVRHTEVDVQQLSGSNADDDTYFRNDWKTNYSSFGGSYDDYAPAYRYGSEMRTKYRGRNWDDVESDLRSDWGTRYGASGSSTWERMKAAVRSGWNRVTS